MNSAPLIHDLIEAVATTPQADRATLLLRESHSIAVAAQTPACQIAESTEVRLNCLESNISSLVTAHQAATEDIVILRSSQASLHDDVRTNTAGRQQMNANITQKPKASHHAMTEQIFSQTRQTE
eukprot:GFKZ01012143.1.p1 GENE.GFKZ01012143.1~~GFKZ01012143.1.p1  ORF type:complete len:125 (-),score=18.73 GFKZ01012143.1:1446-1820(-)